MLERSVESTFTAAAKAWGVWAVKTAILPGFPDRMCLAPGGEVRFAELKRPGEVPRPLQERIHARLRRLGFVVEVADTPGKARDFFDRWMGHA